jgi:hypothetical protein
MYGQVSQQLFSGASFVGIRGRFDPHAIFIAPVVRGLCAA